MKKGSYDQVYAGQEFYWGKKPSAMCDRVMEIISPGPGFRPKLLDLGCGEGKDAVYFAQHGFEVVGLDLSLPGLEKTRRYADEVRVHVEAIHADIVDYELEDPYDVIFSTGTLQYLPPEVRGIATANADTDITSPMSRYKKPPVGLTGGFFIHPGLR